MPDQHMEWYHCGRCGRLFQSPPGDPDARVCSHCGKDPSVGVEAAPAQTKIPPPRPHRGHGRDDGASRHPEISQGRRRNRAVATLVFGWLALMAIVVALFKIFAPDAEEAVKPTTQAPLPKSDKPFISLEQELPACQEILGRYIDAETPSQRAQLTIDPVATASRMARFAAFSTPPLIQASTLKNEGAALLDTPGNPRLEARWKASGGWLIDCVFQRLDSGEWRIDWDHFARYQPESWSAFVSGQGSTEAEFRLLVRRRMLRATTNDGLFHLMLAAPRFGRPEEMTPPGVDVTVAPTTPLGLLLTAGFQKREANIQPFSSLAPLEAEGVLRVRAVIRRTRHSQFNNEYQFELVKIAAFHWHTLDDLGVTPPPDPAQPAPPAK